MENNQAGLGVPHVKCIQTVTPKDKGTTAEEVTLPFMAVNAMQAFYAGVSVMLVLLLCSAFTS